MPANSLPDNGRKVNNELMTKPYVTSKVAMSLDGHIDDLSKDRLLLSSKEDMSAVDALRAEQDALLVGAGTLRTDNPRLVIRSEELRAQRRSRGLPPDPIKVAITSSGNVNPELQFFHCGEAQKILYCPASLHAQLDIQLRDFATVIPCPSSRVDPAFVLDDLSARGVKKLLIEGGQQIHSLFLQAGLVDELRIAIAPFFVGQDDAPRFVNPGRFPHGKDNRMTLIGIEKEGDMAVFRYKLAPAGKC